jgi:hypothetical protein
VRVLRDPNRPSAVTIFQRAHLVVALGIVNLCLVAMGLAMSSASLPDRSTLDGNPIAAGRAQASPVEDLAGPASSIRPNPRQQPGVAREAAPGSSPSSSKEPGSPGGPVAERSSVAPLPQASGREVPGTPTLSSHDSGLVTVSRGHPVATVTVTIRASDAVFGSLGARSLSVHLQGAIRQPGRVGEFHTPVVAAIARVGSPASQLSWSSRPELDDRLESSCPANGECVESYRIVVALVDPAVRTATFAWTAAARAVVDRGVFPSDAKLTVKATHRATIRRAATALQDVAVQHLQLDADHRRLVREVTISLPDGLDREELAGVLVRAAVKPNAASGQPSGDVAMAVSLDGRRLTSSRPGDVGPFVAFDPFAGCRVAKPCQVVLRVEFRAVGAATTPITIDWALSGWAADPRLPAQAPGLSVVLGGTSEISPETPRRSKQPASIGSTSG